MGLSPSKRVKTTFKESPAFDSACAAGFADCLSLAQHAFTGVRPYQLLSAAERLHTVLSDSLALISKWVPSPPDRTQVDRALKTVLARRPVQEEEVTMEEAELKEFAVEVFTDAVVSNAGVEVLKRLPLGVAGIAGFGAVVKPGKGVVAAAVGAYALGVVTSIYLGLDELRLETRGPPPSHCLIRIKSFSLLSEHGISRIESLDFEVQECKWRLTIYPDGDETVTEDDYISACVSIVGAPEHPWSEVNAIVTVFVYNHISDTYLCFRGNARRFEAINSFWRIRKLMAKELLRDPSKGYLDDDNCVFGAEVFVIQKQRVVENVRLLALEDPYKRAWRISNFSQRQDAWISQHFSVGGLKWKIKLYRRGDLRVEGRYISVFLTCVHFAGCKRVKASCTFIIGNMVQNRRSRSSKVSSWFTPRSSTFGFSRLVAIEEPGDHGRGMFVNDCCNLDIQLSVEATHRAFKVE